MKLKNILLIADLFLFLSVLITGCKKDEPVSPNLSSRDILINNSWQVSKALDLSTKPGEAIDITSKMSLTFITFNADGRYSSSVDNGGTWELSDQDKKIIFNKNLPLQMTAEIIELKENLLHIKMNIVSENSSVLCDITFVPVKYNSSPEVNFETLWKEFDARYSFFEIKKINWDSLYSVFRPQVTSKTTNEELFQIMSNLLYNLKDGHVNLYTQFGTFAYTEWYTKYPENYISFQAVSKYLISSYGPLVGGNFSYGKISNDIGYISIRSILSTDFTGWASAIDQAIDSLKNTKGIIVDLRNNDGGSEIAGQIIAGRFTTQVLYYDKHKVRNGPKHTDFTPIGSNYISPGGIQQYTKPVALLTNRRCFSSTEGTILMFRALPNVTTIGDTSGGGSGNPVVLQLPNKWTYRLSTWIQYTPKMEIFEGKGLPPDIPVEISPADMAIGKDTILEYAISFLMEKAVRK